MDSASAETSSRKSTTNSHMYRPIARLGCGHYRYADLYGNKCYLCLVLKENRGVWKTPILSFREWQKRHHK